MDCITPSHPTAIPHGISQTIVDTLAETNYGTLFKDGRPMSHEQELPTLHIPPGHMAWTPSGTQYRSNDLSFLLAQNATSERALKMLEREALSGQQWDWNLGSESSDQASQDTTSVRKVALTPPRVAPAIKRAARTVPRPERPVTSIPLRRAPDSSSRVRD